MGKYIDLENFEKKFERMINNIPASVDSGAGYVIDEVYKIIASLRQEQPEVDIKKELKNLIRSNDNGCSALDIARHFAKWGAEHARNAPLDAETIPEE